MVKWNSAAIYDLTGTIVESLQKLNDDELAYVIQTLYEEDWDKHLEDDGFRAIVNSLAILGLASYGLRRAQDAEKEP